jgi:ribonuclease P protein subunit RPR2
MAKKDKSATVQNKALYSRISFLQQAATYLATTSHKAEQDSSSDCALHVSLQNMSRRLATDMRSVSLKTRIRMSPAVKRTICKFCDSVLLDGESCTTTVENNSNGSRKPWADILVRKCQKCGKEKRYPLSARRPPRKTARAQGNSKDSKPAVRV